MTKHLVLLPGWAFGTAALAPLMQALQAALPDWQVQCPALPPLHDAHPDTWLDALDAQLPPTAWLGGWSLGGMLASALAARRGAQCPGLITLASNPCFVARPDWPQAMPVATFDTFAASMCNQPEATLKRFAQLCSQGADQPRELARQLLSTLPVPADVPTLSAALQVLATLDTRAALHTFGGPQWHGYAEGDALVPASAAQAVQALCPRAHTTLLQGTSHALPLSHATALAAALADWLPHAAAGAHP